MNALTEALATMDRAIMAMQDAVAEFEEAHERAVRAAGGEPPRFLCRSCGVQWAERPHAHECEAP